MLRETRAPSRSGSRVPVLAGGTTFEGVSDQGLGFMIDLTERKRDEAEIRALKEQLYRENLVLRDEVARAAAEASRNTEIRAGKTSEHAGE